MNIAMNVRCTKILSHLGRIVCFVENHSTDGGVLSSMVCVLFEVENMCKVCKMIKSECGCVYLAVLRLERKKKPNEKW